MYIHICTYKMEMSMPDPDRLMEYLQHQYLCLFVMLEMHPCQFVRFAREHDRKINRTSNVSHVGRVTPHFHRTTRSFQMRVYVLCVGLATTWHKWEIDHLQKDKFL